MSIKVPFLDLSRIHAPVKDDVLSRISSIIDRSAFVLGPEVAAFEKEFSSFVGTRHTIGVSSGLDALKLALRALSIGPGDEVITAANTFVATAFAISSTGAKVVLVDIEENSCNIDPAQVARAISPKTKAILPVHLYGQPATMAPLVDLAAKHGIPVIEDAAQAHGAVYQGKSCGSMGVMGCFSFYPGKNLGAMGEGGAVTTSDDGLKDRLRMLRDVGQKEKYQHEVIGENSRLHTIQAAILSAKLPGLASQNEDRARIARRYGEQLADLKGIALPKNAPDRTHVYHLYVIETLGTAHPKKEREALQAHLLERQIHTGIHYPNPVHLQKCYAHLGKGPGSFPISERRAESILSLPIFPAMRDEEVDAVCQGIREFYKQ